MKKFITFFLFLLVLHSVIYAQNYQPMAVEGAHWFMTRDVDFSTPWEDEFFSFTIRGDTIVKNTNYKKIYKDDFSIDQESKLFLPPYKIAETELIGFIRDDTLKQQVWAYNIASDYLSLTDYSNNCNDQEEYLLYDFSVQQGDSLSWCYLKTFGLQDEKPPLVDSTNIFINERFGNSPRKNIYTTGFFPVVGDGFEETQTIIEGVGYEKYGLFIEVYSLFASYCVGKDSDCEILVSSNNILSSSFFKAYPNPVSDLLHIIQEDYYKTNLRGKIIDNMGRLVQSFTLSNSTTSVDTSTLSKGIYFAVIYDNEKSVFSTRFIKL